MKSQALVAQGIEHSFPKAGVAGSNPAGGIPFFSLSSAPSLLAGSNRPKTAAMFPCARPGGKASVGHAVRDIPRSRDRTMQMMGAKRSLFGCHAQHDLLD